MARSWQERVRQVAPLGWMALFAAPFVYHSAIAGGQWVGLAIFLAAIQMTGLVALAWRHPRGGRGLGVVAGLALLALLMLWLTGSRQADRAGLMVSSGVSHAILHASLLTAFARSLAPGRTPLITSLAQRLRGTLTPAMRHYTRIVTKAWCVFFAGQLVASAVLLATAPSWLWSLFVNVLDGGFVAAMFLAEYGVRRWRFRGHGHSSPLAALRAFARPRTDG